MLNRILIVEDDIGISEIVALELKNSGYDCEIFDNGNTAVEYLKKDHSFDLALLDIMLPGIDGFDLLSYMKKYSIPVIYMTAKTDSESEIKGLRNGAEDYIIKPFDVEALLVRIEKVLERTGKLNSVYRFKNIVIDVENRTISQNGQLIDLQPMEFDVLVILIKNKNRTVTREKILNEVWSEEYFGDTRTVDVRIANIRRKLGLNNEIKTITKAGYRLEER